MAIIFNESTKTFYLESKEITYAFYINKIGFPEHLYFGRRVGHDALNYSYSGGATSHRAYIPEYNISYNDLPAEVPFYGNGDFREPMLGILDTKGGRLHVRGAAGGGRGYDDVLQSRPHDDEAAQHDCVKNGEIKNKHQR